MTLRATIRPGCNGMGSCVRLAPAVFRMDALTGQAKVILEDAEPHREAVLTAARSCPFVGVEIDGVPMEEPIDDAPVVSCTPLAPDIVELRLRLGNFPFTPGQYVFLRLRDAAGEFFRTYSVVDATDGIVTLCIRLVPTGRAGRILTGIAPGTVLGLSRPKGLFALRSPNAPKLFLTGGTGLAPVIPMCLAAPEARKLVVIGARSPASLFWIERVRELPNTQVIAIVQNPGEDWQGPVGQVTEPLATLDLDAWPEIYTCGSPMMVEAVRRALAARNVPAERLMSDSFVPSGSVPPPDPAPARPRRDWAGHLRRLHVLSSAPLALIILFYAITGFIANRSDLFVSENTTETRRILPEGTALDQEHLVPVLTALLPDGCRLETFTPGTNPKAIFANGHGRQWMATVDGTTRTVRLVERGTLPADLPMEVATVAQALSGTLSGEPDLEHADLDDESLVIDFASVWGSHHVQVDRATRTWTASTMTPPLVISLVDLHRGKHTGNWQRIIVDVTALGLALITLSGTAMALMAAAPKRRRLALILLTISAVLMALLLTLR